MCDHTMHELIKLRASQSNQISQKNNTDLTAFDFIEDKAALLCSSNSNNM